MTGKQKCKNLRDIRRKIAEKNGIDLPFAECTYTGEDCNGTCPACESELMYLKQELMAKHDPDIPQYGEEYLHFRVQPLSFCEEDNADELIFDEVLPKLYGDSDKELLVQKLIDAGITTVGDLLRFSPNDLAEFGLTEQELDDLSLRFRFQGKDWIRRRRRSMRDGTRGIMRNPNGFF